MTIPKAVRERLALYTPAQVIIDFNPKTHAMKIAPSDFMTLRGIIKTKKKIDTAVWRTWMADHYERV